MTWPPRPGELWVAEDEWPGTFYRPDEPSVDINVGDVFLVVGVGRVVDEELKPGKSGHQDVVSYKSVSLEVIAHGVKRMIIAECTDGKFDMRLLEQLEESNTIILEEQ